MELSFHFVLKNNNFHGNLCLTALDICSKPFSIRNNYRILLVVTGRHVNQSWVQMIVATYNSMCSLKGSSFAFSICMWHFASNQIYITSRIEFIIYSFSHVYFIHYKLKAIMRQTSRSISAFFFLFCCSIFLFIQNVLFQFLMICADKCITPHPSTEKQCNVFNVSISCCIMQHALKNKCI